MRKARPLNKETICDCVQDLIRTLEKYDDRLYYRELLHVAVHFSGIILASEGAGSGRHLEEWIEQLRATVSTMTKASIEEVQSVRFAAGLPAVDE